MALRRDWRRVSAASATLSAGALVFFAAGTGPASAESPSAAGTSECPLGKLLCGILGQGGSDTPSPKPSAGGGTTTKPSSKPKPRPKPVTKPAPARHGSSNGQAGGAGGAPPVPPAGDAPSIPVPQTVRGPALPDVTDQDPLVVPEAAPGGQSPSTRLVADAAPADGTIPPLLVATASGLIGALAALNLSVLRRRRND